MSRMHRRIATVGLLIATFVGAGGVLTATPASATSNSFKPDICGDFCKYG